MNGLPVDVNLYCLCFNLHKDVVPMEKAEKHTIPTIQNT